MKSRPMLFSAPMVRALLDGSKTQTRRIFKAKNGGVWPHTNDLPGMRQIMRNCPYGRPGDQLWVRETWLKTNLFTEGGPHTYGYRASDEIKFPDAIWKPSIHMPRAASRITLEITAVRLERLQGISERDAIAEGAPLSEGGPCPELEFQSHTLGFWRLWDSINGPGSWAANPLVWVLEFKVLKL